MFYMDNSFLFYAFFCTSWFNFFLVFFMQNSHGICNLLFHSGFSIILDLWMNFFGSFNDTLTLVANKFSMAMKTLDFNAIYYRPRPKISMDYNHQIQIIINQTLLITYYILNNVFLYLFLPPYYSLLTKHKTYKKRFII
jgi:hypothetical protein